MLYWNVFNVNNVNIIEQEHIDSHCDNGLKSKIKVRSGKVDENLIININHVNL